MHDPDVFAALAIGDECDPLAVRRKSRLAVESHTTIDQLGFSAADWQGVDVTEQFEHNGLTVGRNVQREPGALVGGEFDLAVRLERQAFLLFLFVLLFVFFCVFLSFLVSVFLILVLLLRPGIVELREDARRARACNHGKDRRQDDKPHARTRASHLLQVHSCSSVPETEIHLDSICGCEAARRALARVSLRRGIILRLRETRSKMFGERSSRCGSSPGKARISPKLDIPRTMLGYPTAFTDRMFSANHNSQGRHCTAPHTHFLLTALPAYLLLFGVS